MEISKDKFKDNLSRQIIKKNYLNPGYKIILKKKDIHNADKLNKEYCKIVWGIKNSAVNKKACNDELQILDIFLNNENYNSNVLECGCGSGRITKFIYKKCDNLLLLDYNDEVKKYLQKYLKCGNVTFLHSDLKKIKGRNFTLILLLENFMGMVLNKSKRTEIYHKILENLSDTGIAIFGVRIRNELSTNFIYQVFPYRPRLNNKMVKLYGITINWNLDYFITELEHHFNIEQIIEGEKRLSGGNMQYIVASKRYS